MGKWTCGEPVFAQCPVTRIEAWQCTVTDPDGGKHFHHFDTEHAAWDFVLQPYRWHMVLPDISGRTSRQLPVITGGTR